MSYAPCLKFFMACTVSSSDPNLSSSKADLNCSGLASNHPKRSRYGNNWVNFFARDNVILRSPASIRHTSELWMFRSFAMSFCFIMVSSYVNKRHESSKKVTSCQLFYKHLSLLTNKGIDIGNGGGIC